ncbi:MAG: SHOCT domain-containing protein [Clostridia bacterium]|nr:SHOCT domain-containing protein [Clostridia bacterium]
MEEKVLIKSEQYDVKKAFKIMVIIGAILSAIVFLGAVSSNMEDYDNAYERYLEHQEDGDCGWYYESWEKCWACEAIEDSSTKLGYALAETFEDDFEVIIPVAALALVGGLIYLWLRSYELTVTDKRIYGKVAWGKRVDLPVDSVSATATIRVLKGVSVSTSSGRISFRVIKNADEIYKVLNNLLIERQQEKVNATVAAVAPKSDEADQLKKYKDLLDSGVITQEEFDAKKKQLLGL